MSVDDHVEIKEFTGQWKWTNRRGRITGVDNYCFTVLADDGETVRDVKDHFRFLG